MSDEQQSSTSISEDLQRLAEESYKNSRAADMRWRLNETINEMRKFCMVRTIGFLKGVIMDSFNQHYVHNARMAQDGQCFIDTYIDNGECTITTTEYMINHWKKLANTKQADRGAVKLGAIWSLPALYSDICDAMFDNILSLSILDYDYLLPIELVDDSHGDDETNIPAPSKLHSFIDTADVLL